MLGGIACVRGNVPASLLNTGTPEEVDAYCRKLIEVVGKDGGFILDGAVGVPDEAKLENVLAMARSVSRYAPLSTARRSIHSATAPGYLATPNHRSCHPQLWRQRLTISTFCPARNFRACLS